LQAAAPPALDLRVGSAWVPWRAFVAGAPAAWDPLLGRAVRWREGEPGLRVGSFEVRAVGGLLTNSVALVEIDPARYRFALAAAPFFAPRSADAWMADSSVVLAVNTGLFRGDGSPQGLVVLDGVRYGRLAAWLDAVVVIAEGRLRLLTLAEARSLEGGGSAFQVLPWLVQGGRVALGVTSGLRLSRTHRDRRLTLCLGADGLVRLLLSNFEVFGQNAGTIPVGLTIPEQATIAAAAGCADAVALDGGISAQLAVRVAHRVRRMPGWREVPLMLLVRER
jgi:exopolysaccharide biosynthesis protein